jgi:hypothetical protein
MTDKKKIENIYSKIEKISSKGKLYYNEYSELINQFIINGEYSDFEMTLYDKYNINTKGMNSVKMVKEKSWVEILFQSDSNISKKIKKLLDDNYVYQISDSFYYSSLTYSSLTYSEISDSTCSVNFEIGNTDGVTKVYLDLIEPSDIKNINIYNYTHDTYSGDNNIEQSNIGRLIDSINLKSEYEWGFISSTPSVIFPGFMSFYGTQSDCRFNIGDVVKISNGNVESDIISKIKYISGTQSPYYIDVNLINKPYVILSGTINQYPTFNDNIYTNIPITQNGSYVIKIDNIYYFKLTVVKDLFLGKIIELEQYTIDSKYYINNKNIAKLEGRIETYLKVENYNYTKEPPYDLDTKLVKNVKIIGNRNKCTYKDLVDHYEWVVGDYETSSISDDSKLLYRYEEALKYLFGYE